MKKRQSAKRFSVACDLPNEITNAELETAAIGHDRLSRLWESPQPEGNVSASDLIQRTRQKIQDWLGAERPSPECTCFMHRRSIRLIAPAIREIAEHLRLARMDGMADTLEARFRGLDRRVTYVSPHTHGDDNHADHMPRMDFAVVNEADKLMQTLKRISESDAFQAEQKPETPLTLGEFMEEHCVPLSTNLRESRITSLQGLAQKGQVEMKHVNPWRRGQSKRYLPSYLKSQWGAYAEKCTGLPSLKASTDCL